jgi:hypothetical protein
MKKETNKKREVKLDLASLEKNKIKKKECLFVTAGRGCLCIGDAQDHHGNPQHLP